MRCARVLAAAAERKSIAGIVVKKNLDVSFAVLSARWVGTPPIRKNQASIGIALEWFGSRFRRGRVVCFSFDASRTMAWLLAFDYFGRVCGGVGRQQRALVRGMVEPQMEKTKSII